MALTQADVDRLDLAIAGSTLEVEVDGRRIKYRSIAELKDARAHIADVVAASARTTQRSTFFFTPTMGRER